MSHILTDEALAQLKDRTDEEIPLKIENKVIGRCSVFIGENGLGFRILEIDDEYRHLVEGDVKNVSLG